MRQQRGGAWAFSLATAAITSRKSEGELSLICLYRLLKIDLMLSSTSPYIFPIHQHNFLYTVPTKRLGTPPNFQCILMALRVLLKRQ